MRRIQKVQEAEEWLTQGKMSLEGFASGHEYFGLHFKNNQWIFREWAPNATAIYLIGDMTDRQEAAVTVFQLMPGGLFRIPKP